MSDPQETQVATAELGELAAALDVVDERAGLNHRYRKLIEMSRRDLATQYVRLSQARGIAKRLMVLVRASGTGFTESLPPAARDTIESGLHRAHVLVYESDPHGAR